MFLRVVRATVSKGVKREYVRVVEAYRDRDGKTRHRAIINLGRRDVLAEHLDLGKLRHRIFYETQDTPAGIIVDEASSDPGLPGDPPIPVDANHITIA